jgi:hypothetical protein
MTDVGDDISEGPQGPWLTREEYSNPMPSWTTLLPTIQYRSRIALRADLSDPGTRQNISNMFPQSAALLAQDYGNRLNAELMSLDPFYALTDLFAFCAFSEAQCLNLLESMIGSDTNYSSLSQETPTLSNILCCQEILDAHLMQIRTTIEIIKRRGGTNWPHVSKHHKQYESAAYTANALQKDFEDLATRAELHLGRCTRGTKIIMNNVMLAESKQAIAQAQGVARLTLIAFFYIPLSFTTSFFGMNFAQLGKGLSLWIWFATSLPVLVISVSFLYFDAKKLRGSWQKFKAWHGFR